MTHGIVSALNRTNVGILGNQGYEDFIQVDAPINPADGWPAGEPARRSGGDQQPSLSVAGAGSFSGIGFAIPSNEARTIYNTLKDKGKSLLAGWV